MQTFGGTEEEYLIPGSNQPKIMIPGDGTKCMARLPRGSQLFSTPIHCPILPRAH
ncbi:hypothetical protein J4Q44_G00203010 [Coregonus suidteri]|uniref:Uncharacterized protein n=1 Tax=Coregonus suidteri TaxID=861788 RepID=A0AAN8QS21_9TELE